MENQEKIYIVMPAHNEAPVIKQVVKGINDQGYKNIIVVDDGSQDNTSSEVKKCPGTICLRHSINRGKGAATITGIEAAKKLDADIIVTMDADGQHDPNDINKLVSMLKENKCDVASGSRLMDTKGMPWIRIAYNRVGNIILWALFGLYVTDSQTGFRAYSQKAINLIDTQADTYEYDSEVLREVNHHKLRYKEIPIKVIYTEHSLSTRRPQHQGFVNGLRILSKVFWRFVS